MVYAADPKRYETMDYPRCGRSGLKLPRVSLGLWHNFGEQTLYETGFQMVTRAFDLGITHFDLANNYGPPPGAAEANFGRMMRQQLRPYRDEMVISTKAGYHMWEGPYGDWGSRKYILSSLDQSLQRMGLDYVDIFYHHRPDPDTPLEETMAALDHTVRQGKALYVGISNYYAPQQAVRAFHLLRSMGTPCLIHQFRYNMLMREAEDGLFDAMLDEGVGGIVFSPLAGGMLTDRYLHGIPEDSRAGGRSVFLKREAITGDYLTKVTLLHEMAADRGQSLAQMALAWNLRQDAVTSVLIGASKVRQVEDCVKALDNTAFTDDELDRIDSILA